MTIQNIDLYLSRAKKKYGLQDLLELKFKITAYEGTHSYIITQAEFASGEKLADCEKYTMDDLHDLTETLCEELFYSMCPLQGTSKTVANQLEIHVDFELSTVNVEMIKVIIKKVKDLENTLYLTSKTELIKDNETGNFTISR